MTWAARRKRTVAELELDRLLAHVVKLTARAAGVDPEALTLRPIESRARGHNFTAASHGVNLAAALAVRRTTASLFRIGEALGMRSSDDMRRRIERTAPQLKGDTAFANVMRQLERDVLRWQTRKGRDGNCGKPCLARAIVPATASLVSRKEAATALGNSRQRLEVLIKQGRVEEVVTPEGRRIDIEKVKCARGTADVAGWSEGLL